MVIRELFQNFDNDIDTVCCIGFFDSVHRGHKKLIQETVRIAKEMGVKPALITFDKDPLEVISGSKVKQVNTFDKRVALFEKLGIDILYIIHFNEEMMIMDSHCFIDRLNNAMNLHVLICGFDFHFGYKGQGNVEMLKRESSFKTIVINEEMFYGKKVSTTRIKQEIARGNMHLVNRLLADEYSIFIEKGQILNSQDLVLPSAGIYDVKIDGVSTKLEITDSGAVDFITNEPREVIFK